MENNTKLQNDAKDLMSAIANLCSLAEGFDLDHNANIYDLMKYQMSVIEKRIKRISKISESNVISKAKTTESADAFVSDRIVKNPESRLIISEAYEFYRARCSLKKIIPAEKGGFIKSIRKKYPQIMGSKAVNVKGKIVRCYIGFDLKK